jgi:hypothetical protein
LVRCQWIAKCIRKRSCAVEEHLTFVPTVRRDLQRPNASVQRFLIDCAGMRFDCRAALAF